MHSYKTSHNVNKSWLPLLTLGVLVLTASAITLMPGAARAFQCDPPPDPCLNGAVAPAPDGGGNATAPVCSPIIIDVTGNGFHLTSARDGVFFDIAGTGKPIQVAWTASGSANAFLVLDRDNSGLITSGKELFGNFTAQPQSPHPNGFLALAEFDKPENGGNGDGVIITEMPFLLACVFGWMRITMVFQKLVSCLSYPIWEYFLSALTIRNQDGPISSAINSDTAPRLM